MILGATLGHSGLPWGTYLFAYLLAYLLTGLLTFFVERMAGAKANEELPRDCC